MTKNQPPQPPSHNFVPLSSYFKTMEDIIAKRVTSARVRFLLQDLVDLRKSDWVPRREAAGNKAKQRETVERQTILIY